MKKQGLWCHGMRGREYRALAPRGQATSRLPCASGTYRTQKAGVHVARTYSTEAPGRVSLVSQSVVRPARLCYSLAALPNWRERQGRALTLSVRAKSQTECGRGPTPVWCLRHAYATHAHHTRQARRRRCSCGGRL